MTTLGWYALRAGVSRNRRKRGFPLLFIQVDKFVVQFSGYFNIYKYVSTLKVKGEFAVYNI